MIKTAVFKTTKLLLILLLPLASLGWVMQLLAQTVPPRPDFIITEPQYSQGEDGRLQISFIGLSLDDTDVPQLLDGVQVAEGLNITPLQLGDFGYESLQDERFDILLLVDTSGSMSISNTKFINLSQIKSQLTQLIDNAPDKAHFSIVGFNGRVRPNQFTAFTNDKDDLLAQVAQLDSDDGSTCLDDMVYTAVAALAQQPQNTRRAIILFTDGVDETIRSQATRCSQDHTLDDALTLAERQVIPIPLHIISYPYTEDGTTSDEATLLPGENTLLGGVRFAFNETAHEPFFTQTMNRIIASFTHQWRLTIPLFAPAGTYTLDLQPIAADGAPLAVRPLTFTLDRDYLPPALHKDVKIDKVVYNEQTNQFEVQIQLCASGEGYCDPRRAARLDVLVEDVFDHKLTEHTITIFDRDSEPQLITAPITLQPEHYYLMRVTAANGVTADNYHPYGEAVYAYLPQLSVQVHSAELIGRSLQPDLRVGLIVTRHAPIETITPAPLLLANGRFFSTDITPQQPSQVEVTGYLLYDVDPPELYPLPTRWWPPDDDTAVSFAELKEPAYITFADAAPGGYANYKLLLTVADTRDSQATNVAEQPVVIPTLWGQLLSFMRRMMENPLLAVATLLLALALLGLIWLVAWTARRMIQPTAPQPQKDPQPLPQPVLLRVDASPDATVRHQRFPLVNGSFKIGRAPVCDLTVRDDGQLAEIHAEVRRDEYGRFYLINLDEHHRTYINTHEIISHAPIPVQLGDIIRLGAHTRLTLDQPSVDEGGASAFA